MTIGPPFRKQPSAEDFVRYINQLTRTKRNKPKKSRKIISICKTKKSYSIRTIRKPKHCLFSELQSLAESVKLSVPEVEALLRKRKIPVVQKSEEHLTEQICLM